MTTPLSLTAYAPWSSLKVIDNTLCKSVLQHRSRHD